MEVGSAIDLYATLLGWVMYDKLWNAVNASGLAYLPFFGVIVGNFAQAWMKQGMEGAQATVRALEIQLAAMFTVAVLAGSPAIEMKSTDLTYTAACGGKTVNGGSSGTLYDSAFQLGTSQALVPVWWRAVMAVSAGISNAAIASIPCQADLRRLDYRMQNTRITDTDLKGQLELFYQDCYLPARSEFINQHKSLPSTYPSDDIDWPGSQYFQDTNGYYNNANPNLAQRASQEIPNFPFDSTRDAEYGSRAPASGWGKPTCLDWWANQTNGLRQRLIQQIDSGTLNGITTQATAVWKGVTVKSVQDDLIRKLVVQDMVKLDDGKITNEAGSAAVSMLSGAGVAWESVKQRATLYAVKQAAPIGQSLVLMTIYLCLPFLLVFSSFSVPAVLLASLGIFAIRFLTSLWALSTWFDSAMIQALGIEWWKYLSGTNGVAVIIANTIAGLLYIGVPLIWFTVIGWAGHTLVSVGLVASVTEPIGKGAAGPVSGVGKLAGRGLGAGVSNVAKSMGKSNK